MGTRKRILAAALGCVLLAGCGQQTAPALPPETAGELVAYVPLDDRPDNVERVVYLAESLGYDLELPESDLYQTRLNGQPLNANGTPSGDRAALYEWVLDRETAGCDRYILSLDQLLSGGLVNSRAAWAPEPVRLSDGTVLTEQQLLQRLLETLALDPDNQVWLLDSVMRLAPTVGYQHWTLEEYNALRSYGMEGRPVLTGEGLTPQEIEADYRLGRDGTELSPAAFGLEEGEIAEYLSARARKLELADWTQMLLRDETADGGRFHLLVGIDDSSVEDSIQKNEIAYLRQGLRTGDALLSGVDDLAFKAVTKLYLGENPGAGPSAAQVRCYGGTETAPACAYDYQPLTAIMEEHLSFFGMEQCQEQTEGCVQVLVLTQPADETEKERYFRALIEDLQTCRKQELPVILIDAGNGAYGTAFHDALTKETELGWLLSYAGFLDMAIVTGTALSHGVARYAFLRGGVATAETEAAFARTLADSVLKDFCYKTIVREDLLAYIRNDLGGSPDNFWQPEIDRESVGAQLEQGMEESTAAVLDNLSHSNLIRGLAPYTEIGWGSVTLEHYRFPWDRAFEIGMDIRLGPFLAPHEKLLGVYVS